MYERSANKHVVKKIEFDLTGSGRVSFYTKTADKTINFDTPHYPDRKMFHTAWGNCSIGHKIYRMFCDSGFTIPKKVPLFTVKVSRDLIIDGTVDEDILNFVNKSKCVMNKWKVKNDSVEIRLSNVNPFELIGALAASIRKNQSALGRQGLMLDVGEMERLPSVREFEEIYIK